jgi:pimeloyl-ACP methyl ester carboxylesterase
MASTPAGSGGGAAVSATTTTANSGGEAGWHPPSSSLPTTLLSDLAHATAASLLALAWRAGSLGPRALLSTALDSTALDMGGSAAVFCVCFVLSRLLLPPLSYDHLIRAEAILLSTVRGEVRHGWAHFATKHARWTIHYLKLTSSSDGRIPLGVPATWRRPTVVLLPGHSAGAALHEAVLDRLSALADVYVLDLPGWGRSPAPSVLTTCRSPSLVTSLHTEMLLGWLDAALPQGHGPVVLVGHSLGGYHSLAFASAHPERVEQLVLIAPVGLYPIMPEGSLTWGLFFRFLPPQRIARLTGRIGYALFRGIYGTFTTEDPRFVDYYFLAAFATRWTGAGDRPAASFMRLSLTACGLWWARPVLSLLMELEKPVSVIWGTQDEVLPAVLGAILHRIRPQTSLYYIRDALHNPAHSNSRAVCDALADVLLKLRGAPRLTVAGRGGGQGWCADGSAERLLLAGSGGGGEAPGVAVGHVEALLGATAEEAACFAAAAPPTGVRLPTPLRISCAADPSGPFSHHSAAPCPSSPISSLSAAEAEEEAGVEACAPPGGRRWSSSGAGEPTEATSTSSEEEGGEDAVGDGDDEDDEDDGDAEGAVAADRGVAAAAAAATAAAVTASPQPGPTPPLVAPTYGIGSELGVGRGHCRGCGHAVYLFKSYWRCGCSAWSFNAHVRSSKTAESFAAMRTFLDELYVHGTFDARSSTSISLFLKPHTPLPKAADEGSRASRTAPPVSGPVAVVREGVIDAAASVGCAAKAIVESRAAHALLGAAREAAGTLVGEKMWREALGSGKVGGRAGGGLAAGAAARVDGRRGGAGEHPFQRGDVFLLD